MKRTLLLAAMAIFFYSSYSQDILLFEDFETGGAAFTLNTSDEGGVSAASGSNQWIVNSSYAGAIGTEFCNFSDVVVQNIPAQPAGISSPDGNYMHMYSDQALTDFGNDNCNIMTADGSCANVESNFAAMTSDISTTGYTGVTINFWWICECTGLSYGEVWYSTDAGGTWTQHVVSDYYANTSWLNDTQTNVAWDGQASLRFGFRFVNEFDGSFNNYIGFGIDDFEISGTAGAGCSDTFSSFSASDCSSYTVPSGDETYTTSGTVMDTIPNSAGCDSIMTISVTIGGIIATVVDNGDGTATASPGPGGGISYQWIDCDNGNMPIVGATSNTYDAGVFFSGNVACIVTDGACSDTTACIPVIFDALEENGFGPELKLYPNPAENFISIELGATYQSIELSITDLSGRVVRAEKFFVVNSIQNYEVPAESGLYFVNLISSSGEKVVLRFYKR
jgi:hypothetical protein